MMTITATTMIKRCVGNVKSVESFLTPFYLLVNLFCFWIAKKLPARAIQSSTINRGIRWSKEVIQRCSNEFWRTRWLTDAIFYYVHVGWRANSRKPPERKGEWFRACKLLSRERTLFRLNDVRKMVPLVVVVIPSTLINWNWRFRRYFGLTWFPSPVRLIGLAGYCDLSGTSIQGRTCSRGQKKMEQGGE